jgi:ABC-type uncharacterized transport system fused permease/ATPase subunit
MRDKLIKAYKTAWRWPQVYTSSAAVIWTSRAIVVLIPLSLVVLTIITGIPAIGVVATGILAFAICCVLIFATVRVFYQEYETVEDFQARENRVKEFFHGFPSITSTPLIEHEKGEWIAYGHIPAEQFIADIQLILQSVTDDPEKYTIPPERVNSVGHLYASFTNPAEGHWDEGLTLCKPSFENCFPITRLEL